VNGPPAPAGLAPGTPLVEALALARHFPLRGGRVLRAVDGVSLAVGAGEVVGLVGESGSGKSTFGRTLLGLHDKTAGEARFRGELLPRRYRAADFARWSRHMQMIFQDPYASLNPRMTVAEIVGEGLRLHTRLPPAAVRDRVVAWLERVGLAAGHLGRYPHEFSGGQRQRIGIARALIVEPEFVVCDEPISALDVSVQAQVVGLLEELQRTLGLTLLLIAHDLSMVRHVSDRMAVMYAGALVEVGAADAVFFTPLHPYTQMLVAANPEPDPLRERARVLPPDLAAAGEAAAPVAAARAGAGPAAGCRFVARCPHAGARCRQEAPVLRAVGVATGPPPGPRLVACHLHA
jgi:oligopeptide/dipeptide ABC transporter ATP-binding protein